MMRSVLFDDRGEVWDARSRGLADDLQASIGGEELADYAIRNLGFVGVKETDGSLRIRCGRRSSRRSPSARCSTGCTTAPSTAC